MNRNTKAAMQAGADAMEHAAQREIAALRWERFILWLIARDAMQYEEQWPGVLSRHNRGVCVKDALLLSA